MKAKELQEFGQWKVGEDVVFNYPAPNKHRAVRIIEKITDGRGCTIYCGGLQFDINGNQRAGNRWSFYSIEKLTPEIQHEIVKANRKTKLLSFDFSSLTNDQASDIVLRMREIMGIKI